jgi:hypothetical protein
MHGDPIVVVTGILEQAKSVAISRNRAANFLQQVLLSVVAEVRKRDAVSLVEFARAGGRRDIGEEFSIVVVQQDVGE